MATTLEPPTRLSLLDRARDPADQKAWADFVECYAGLIRHWCRGLQDADRDDVTQAILCRLFQRLPGFQYDPSKGRFRGWLRTMVNHAIVDRVREQEGQPGGRGSGDTAVLEQLHGAPAPDDASIEDPVAESTGQTEPVQRVLDGIRQRVKAKTWLAFWLTTVEGQSSQEVAEQLKMKKVDVPVYKHRVIKMIRSEIEGAAG
jgi:RNA polymerase sigma-70 factor, ECF subfamily